VLVTGGTSAPTAELYDPRTGRWTEAGAPLSGVTTATLLATGQVLVTGGAPGTPTQAALYDPPSGHWRRTGAPPAGLAGLGATATRLPGGQVLLVGPATVQSDPPDLRAAAALYAPATGCWAVLTPPPPHAALFGHTATLLQDGAVLIAGGATMTHALGAAVLYR
jgi:hypothetical protein